MCSPAVLFLTTRTKHQPPPGFESLHVGDLFNLEKVWVIIYFDSCRRNGSLGLPKFPLGSLVLDSLTEKVKAERLKRTS